jgi:hypothetical protein
MINIDKKKYIISLGGSLICPPEGIDIEFLCEFDKFIREKVKEGNKFFITCGGGITSRNYINAATNVIGVGLKDFDKDPKKLSFLGNPIDFVYFGEDEIVFIEVKSGKSQLNKNQRTVRDLVKDKKVSFEIFRVE